MFSVKQQISVSRPKVLSFGNGAVNTFNNLVKGGETYVITPSSLYFDKFTPNELFKENFQPETRKYFTTFRRLSQICNKTGKNNNFDGCKIITSVTENEFEVIKKLTSLSRDKRANFWLPNIVGIKETGDINIHGATNYSKLTKNIEHGADNKKLIDEILNTITAKNTSDLVIAVGNKDSDLEFLDPFKRLGLNANTKDSFDKIKDLPFKSAFICNKNTPKSLINRLENLAKKCNADGQLRFIIIKAGSNFPINKIAHSILLLQKSFASTSAAFCSAISKQLKKVLEYRKLNYRNKKITPLWIKPNENKKTNFIRKAMTFLKENKATSLLLLAAGVIPFYFQKIYLENKKHKY